MPTIGPRCHKLRVVDKERTWRIVYRVELGRHRSRRGLRKDDQGDAEAVHREQQEQIEGLRRGLERKAHAMKKAKQKRLAAAGWRVGTPAEFLKLDDIESQVVEIKLSLSEALRAAREQRHWTQTQLAEKIGSSQSRVARMEGGDQGVSLDLLVQGLLAAGATRRAIAKAVAHRKRAVSA